MKKLIALLLCLVMVLSVVACTPTEKPEETKQPAANNDPADETKAPDETEPPKNLADEVNEITVLTWTGIEPYPGFDKFCQETFGIKWENVMDTDGAMDALLASGELPGMVYFTDEADMRAAAEGGMLLDLDEYKDQLPNVYSTGYAEYYEPGMARTRDMFGGCYGLPIGVGAEYGAFTQPRIRWDIYEALGYPEIETMDDYLPLLKQMQDKANEVESDVKHYAIGMWTDWDKGLYSRNAQGITGYWGYYNVPASKLTEQYADGTMAPKSILDDDSAYKRALQYLFDANQMGLIDPDSKTMVYQDYKAKVLSGVYMATDFRNHGEVFQPNDDGTYMGYAPLWIDEFELPGYPHNACGYLQWVGVSADCEYPEKVLAYLDWYYSIDGLRTVYCGPEGECWTWDGDTRVFTEAFMNARANGETYELEDGGIYTFYSFCSQPALASAFPDLSGDGCVDAKMNPGIFGAEPNQMYKSWGTIYGDYFNMDAYQDANGRTNFMETSALFNLVPTASDEITTLETRIGEVIIKNSWAMVFAKDQAEFDALWEELKAEAAELGMEKVVADANVRWGQAKEYAEKYGVEF